MALQDLKTFQGNFRIQQNVGENMFAIKILAAVCLGGIIAAAVGMIFKVIFESLGLGGGLGSILPWLFSIVLTLLIISVPIGILRKKEKEISSDIDDQQES